MLGFGKKKDKGDAGETPAAKTEAPEKPEKAGKGKDAGKKGASKAKEMPGVSAAARKAAVQPTKKRFSIKKLLIALVILGVLGGGGYAGYTFFFKAKDPSKRVYKAAPLPHLTLPKEMIKFTFDHFPALYDAFLVFEAETTLLETEIARIEAVAAKYPEQQKITDRQKKIWEKGKNTLLKEFAKLEKPVKETFVLFQVNPKLGQEQIDALAPDLADSAGQALAAVQELTADIKARSPEAPEGFIRGTLYKLKKKFL